MSTENVEVFNRYYGNGVATQFSIGFPYVKREFVKVYLYKKDTDEENVLNSDQFYFVNDTTIQYPVLPTDEILKEGDILTIQRETELGSEFEFDNQRRLFPVEVMNADDLAFQQIQELSREIKRAVRVNPTAAETPEELLQTVYDKLDSATEIAGDAISAANQAQAAADNATDAVNSAEQKLVQIQDYIDSAKIDIDNTVLAAKEDVNTAVDEATMNISDIVSDAEGSITNIAVTEANKAIANAAQEATDTATANVNNYVNGTILPPLQTYVDQAQEDANSAATSMEQAALSATAASNYASNASADADNAAESAGLAANSAADAATSKTNAKASETNAKIWAEGTDAQVQALGGVHSSKVWAEQSTNANIALTNSPYTTNRILEIPQDIKLELNNGTLTLKAGSKIRYPDGKNEDGLLRFGEIVLESDLTYSNWGSASTDVMLFYNGSAISAFSQGVYSGSTAPTLSETNVLWYDTANNLMKYTSNSGSTWAVVNYSLPLGLVARSSGTATGVKQVFNGFGYIGSTVFALPGVKVQTTFERNADGTYKSEIWSTQSVLTRTRTAGGTDLQWYIQKNISNGTTDINALLHYYSSSTIPSTGPTYSLIWCEEDGGWYATGSTGTATKLTNYYFLKVFSSDVDSTGKVSNFKTYSVDSVANSNASNFSQAGRSYLSGLAMPSIRYINLTLGASGSTYTAPANGWVTLNKSTASTNQYAFGLVNENGLNTYSVTPNSGGYNHIFFPVMKGQTFRIDYTSTGVTNYFRFIYAEGEE